MRLTLAIIATLSSAPAIAHDFWLEPRAFQVEAGAEVPITIQVGHGAANQRWAAPPTRIARLEAVGPRGTIDLRPALLPPGGPADIVARLGPAGSYVIAMVTNYATSDLPALRFNDYAKVEGLTPILEARTRAGTTDRPGREIYSRRAKAIVEVGDGDAGAAAVTRALGLSLEITPMRNPYRMGKDRTLPVQVLFEGRPLAGALVKLNSLEFDMKPVAERRTDAAGRATFRVPATGDWQLNVIWSKPIAGDPRGDFDTTFSSLTFGYFPGRAAR